MAASAVPASVEKRLLRNSPMYINRVQSNHEKKITSVQWAIHGFRKLKRGIQYKNYIPGLSWHLSLRKDRQTLYVKVVPEEFNKTIKCSIVYAPLSIIEIQETGRYEYQVPFTTIQNPKNRYYENDSLFLDFRFEIRTVPEIRPFTGSTDNLWLSNEIIDAIKRIEITFFIRCKNGDVIGRKDFLAARSRFFYNYFKQNPDSSEYFFDEKREILSDVGVYILSGCIRKPDKLEEIIELFKLAAFLGIPVLKSRGEALLNECMNRDNVYQIREAGGNSGTESLVRAADDFLEENLT